MKRVFTRYMTEMNFSTLAWPVVMEKGAFGEGSRTTHPVRWSTCSRSTCSLHGHSSSRRTESRIQRKPRHYAIATFRNGAICPGGSARLPRKQEHSKPASSNRIRQLSTAPRKVLPNTSLKLTRYGMRCKPGPRHVVHHRSPGLQRTPTRAA
jgi:hypothetical protein